MAFFHLNLSPTAPLPLPRPSQSYLRKPPIHLNSTILSRSSPLTKLEPPPLLEPPHDKSPASKDQHATPPLRPRLRPPSHGRKNDFYLNVGVAVRTLRDDLPSLFSKDLNYDIYREDITFIDPLSTFQGMGNYRLIFWALRFHGRILFREIRVEVFRVWQPSENSIWIRWEMQGVPRVPWEAKGRFQGTSRYKVDRNGKIYEHKVDNLAFNFPQTVARPASVLDFVAAAFPPSPNLTFWGDPYKELASSSWLELYRAVRGTLVQIDQDVDRAGLDSLVGCL
ncbi:uncharacterized protein LOC110021542 [Phalaenopsis equestris]|uniref:uncharacterized protein LOC110021542 n=1 Tax=Phalaenopsis equestris TaxID=78828 RepID=UPI0009E460C8|nr:uncharacterized protein LOC110021542 [Phalaenopsis equestris]